MPFCTSDRTSALYDSTPVENLFLTEYLPSAPDNYLRVYLYARMMCLHPELGSEQKDLERALNLDGDTVFNAMTYWERQGLVRRLSDQDPPTYAFLPVLRPADTGMDSDYYRYRDFNAGLQALFGGDNLLHPRQYEMANDWLNVFGFSQDAVLRLVEARLKASRSKKPDVTRFFNRLNDTIRDYADRGITTLQDVELALETDGRIDRCAAAVMKRLSMHRAATQDELKLVRRWMDEWNFTQQQILDACEETTRARTPSISYLNGILENRLRGDAARSHFDAVKAILRDHLGDLSQPTADQMNAYQKLLDRGFEPETIAFAAAQCGRKQKRRFTDVEWMLDRWAADGVHTLAEAQRYVSDMNEATRKVGLLLEKAGSDRRPQMDDLTRYRRWAQTWPEELIVYAAECARGTALPMRYVDKLLASWQSAQVQTLEDARRQQAGRVRPAGGDGAAKVNPALNYQQRTYAPQDYSGLYVDLNDENILEKLFGAEDGEGGKAT